MRYPQHEVGGGELDSPPVTLSANIYCDRHFDDVLRQVVAPLRQELETLAGPGAFLWFSRYSRCGQHIKLRVHTADETSWPALQSRILLLAEALFATLPVASEDAEPRASAAQLPAIDEEDERDEVYPDRSVLWTRFRPSPLTVGNKKYLQDQRLLNLFYRCMAANAGLVLTRLRVADGEPALKVRQTQLLQTLLGSLFALDLTLEEKISYLVFHRDWLLRPLLAQSPPEIRAEETIERLNQKLGGMESTVTALSSIIAGQLALAEEEKSETAVVEDEFTGLRATLRGFFAHVRHFRGRPEYDLDPYTSDYTFLPLFKVLHHFANQIGVPVLNEFYSYHLLLRAAENAAAAATVVAGEIARDE